MASINEDYYIMQAMYEALILAHRALGSIDKFTVDGTNSHLIMASMEQVMDKFSVRA